MDESDYDYDDDDFDDPLSEHNCYLKQEENL